MNSLFHMVRRGIFMNSNDYFDICVIGDGIASKVFLWNLITNTTQTTSVSKSQNLTIAVVSNDKMAPACTLRSSATVSLNGISEDVSPLGNDMREAYFLFDDFFKNHQPKGVIPVNRVVVATNEKETQKLSRRYKEINTITSSQIKGEYLGIEYLSYLLSPKELLNWFDTERERLDPKKNIQSFNFFVTSIKNLQDGFLISDSHGHEVKAKKIVLATGAFAKVYQHFFHDLIGSEKEAKSEIKAGFYLERTIDLGTDSFYLSIDGTNILYRHSNEKNAESFLQIGSVSVLGAFPIPPEKEILDLLEKTRSKLNIEIGKREDFQVICGLRHKAPKRMIEAIESTLTKNVFHLNGYYKNGFSMSFLGAKRMEKLLNNKNVAGPI
jgi:hypothetical protein